MIIKIKFFVDNLYLLTKIMKLELELKPALLTGSATLAKTGRIWLGITANNENETVLCVLQAVSQIAVHFCC